MMFVSHSYSDFEILDFKTQRKRIISKSSRQNISENITSNDD